MKREKVARVSQGDFQFELFHGQAIAPEAAIEAVAMFTCGQVCGEIAMNRVASYRAVSADKKTRIIGEVLANAEPAADENLPALHYCVLAGFFKSQISTTYRGRGLDRLPGTGTLKVVGRRRQPRFVNPFQDHLPVKKRTPGISPKTLAGIHASFTTLNSIAECIAEGEFVRVDGAANTQRHWDLLKHTSGAQVQVVLGANDKIASHAVVGYTPALASTEEPTLSKEIVTVRTWGEAWVRHDDPRQSILSALVILPGEIGIFTDSLFRYHVEDLPSLTRLKAIEFGEACSNAYQACDFLAFARRYLHAGDSKLASACFEQALLLNPTPEQCVEIERARERIALAAKPLARMRRRSLNWLRSQLNETEAAGLNALLVEREVAYLHSDYGRYPMEIYGVTSESADEGELYAKGLTPSLLAALTSREMVQSLVPQKFELFHTSLGSRRLWGSLSSHRYAVSGFENTIFE